MKSKAKKKKKRASKGSKPSLAERFKPDPEWMANAGRVLALLSAIALVVVVIWSAHVVRNYVKDEGRFGLESCVLQVEELPGWVTPEISEEIRQLRIEGEDVAEIDIFEAGALSRVEEILEGSPWVRDVSDLNLVYPTPERLGVIEASIRFRTPVALVRIGDNAYLTDADELRLGKPYDAEDDKVHAWFGLPVIAGAPRGLEVPRAGDRWQSRSVLEGVDVARMLFDSGVLDEFPEQPIETIDVSFIRGGGRGEIVLLSGGRKLFWGRSSYSDDARVSPIDRKLAHLRQALSDQRYQGRDVILYSEQLVSSVAQRRRSPASEVD